MCLAPCIRCTDRLQHIGLLVFAFACGEVDLPKFVTLTQEAQAIALLCARRKPFNPRTTSRSVSWLLHSFLPE